MDKQKKLCLGVDTASDETSVALVSEDGVSAVRTLTAQRGQGEALMGLIQDVLVDLHKTPQDLTHIAVTVGPGSFTGVRIGLATARGLGLALHIPVFGITNFIATAYTLKHPVQVVLDTKRGDYFVQDFDAQGKAIHAPSVQSAEQMKSLLPFTAIGSGAQALADEIGCALLTSVEPIALSAARIVFETPHLTQEPHPMYLRDADVTL